MNVLTYTGKQTTSHFFAMQGILQLSEIERDLYQDDISAYIGKEFAKRIPDTRAIRCLVMSEEFTDLLIWTFEVVLLKTKV